MPMNEQTTLTLTDVETLANEIFLAHGVAAAQAKAIATIVTAAERDGCKSHGLFRVPGYIKSVRSGKVNKDAEPVLEELAPGVLRIDAKHGFAPLALERGRQPLVEKTRTQGIAALAINNCYHFAALWPEVEALAEQGLVALACTNAMSYVAPAGGSKPLYGTNPLAFAWPRPNGHPLVFDQASSASARGEIMLAQRDGHAIPEGWAIDADGNPTTDPASALAGAQLTFGGYKGAAIALMVELLAGALIGDLFSFEVSASDNRDGGPPVGGELLIAIDPNRCRSNTANASPFAHAETLFAKILEQDGARLPSDRRYRNRELTPTEGVNIPQSLYDELQRLRRGP